MKSASNPPSPLIGIWRVTGIYFYSPEHKRWVCSDTPPPSALILRFSEDNRLTFSKDGLILRKALYDFRANHKYLILEFPRIRKGFPGPVSCWDFYTVETRGNELWLYQIDLHSTLRKPSEETAVRLEKVKEETPRRP